MSSALCWSEHSVQVIYPTSFKVPGIMMITDDNDCTVGIVGKVAALSLCRYVAQRCIAIREAPVKGCSTNCKVLVCSLGSFRRNSIADQFQAFMLDGVHLPSVLRNARDECRCIYLILIQLAVHCNKRRRWRREQWVQ